MPQRQAVTFKALEAPTLDFFERKALVKFMDEKKVYNNLCKHYGIPAASIKDMIALPVLRSICLIEIEKDVTEDTVTAEDVEGAIRGFLDAPNYNGKWMEEAFAEIQMSFEHDDPTTRVHKYCEAIYEMLRENGWYGYFLGEKSDSDAQEKLIEYLINGIRPFPVKAVVEQRMMSLDFCINTSVRTFWRILKECAVTQGQFSNKRKNISRKADRGRSYKRGK